MKNIITIDYGKKLWGETSMPLIKVMLTNDYLQKVMRVSPTEALAELIWNALDADATQVIVSFKRDGLDKVENIRIQDNGHGIFYDTINDTFGNLGNSIKIRKDKTPAGRGYHGKYGSGRYKALSLGSHVTWKSVYFDSDLGNREFVIKCNHFKATTFDVSDEPKITDQPTGVIVNIEGIQERAATINTDKLISDLIKRFAAYILAYKDIKIIVDDKQLNPSHFIEDEREYDISVQDDIKAVVHLIRWKEGDYSRLYICTENGISLLDMPLGVNHGDLPLSVYLQSKYFEELQEHNILELINTIEEFQELQKRVREIVRDYYREWLTKSAADAVQNLKKEGVYPYKGKPKDIIEKAERQVFDICAVKIHEMHPEFSKASKSHQKLMLKLLKEALVQKPSGLNRILREVLELPEDDLKDFAEILKKTSLSAIISTTKMVSDRLKFLNGLEQIIYDKRYSQHLKERSQLHKILLGELWIFGEQYTYGCDDLKLYNVLKEYVKYLGREELAKELKPEEIKDLNDIPDICLWSQYGGREPGEVENLVIELKRPSVTIDDPELTQISKYAYAVANNRRFPKEKTTWKFILVGSAISKRVEDLHLKEYQGLSGYYGGKDDSLTIWVKDWGQIINEAAARHKYLQENLKLAVEDNAEGLSYLQRKYSEYFPDQISFDIEEVSFK
jgi:hypothetical protein